MATYYCTRERFGAGAHINRWNIPNPDRIDGSSNQIHLAEEIEVGIPAKVLCAPCGVTCTGDQCTIEFTAELTAGEQTTLTTIINNHKNNT
jgi:hypothetical protein